MMELMMIALASIGIAVVAVWLYRKVTESRGVTASLVSLSEHRGAMRLSAQQGYVRLHTEAASARRPKRMTQTVGKARLHVRSRSGNKGVRKPWGW